MRVRSLRPSSRLRRRCARRAEEMFARTGQAFSLAASLDIRWTVTVYRSSFRLSFRPFVHPSVHPSVRPSVRSFIHLSVLHCVRPSVRHFIRPFIRPFVIPFVHPSSVRPFVCSSVVRPSVRPSFRSSSIRSSIRHTSRPSVHSSVRRLSIRPSSVPPSFNPSVLPSVCPSLRRSSVIRPSVRPSVYPYVDPSVHPSVRPSFHPSVRLSVRSSVRLSTRPSVRPSVLDEAPQRPAGADEWLCRSNTASCADICSSRKPISIRPSVTFRIIRFAPFMSHFGAARRPQPTPSWLPNTKWPPSNVRHCRIARLGERTNERTKAAKACLDDNASGRQFIAVLRCAHFSMSALRRLHFPARCVSTWRTRCRHL